MSESHQPTTPTGESPPVAFDLKDKITSAQEVVKTKYRVVSESTDDYVHEAPWKAVAMALIGGLIIGMLARR